MPVFKGNCSASATSTAYNNPLTIVSFTIVNKAVGAATVNVSILYGSTNILIAPYNQSIAANGIYSGVVPVSLLPGYQIYVLTNQNIDFYFSLENV